MRKAQDTGQAARKRGKLENGQHTAEEKEQSPQPATSAVTKGTKRHVVSGGATMPKPKRSHADTSALRAVQQQQQAVEPLCDGIWPLLPASLAVEMPQHGPHPVATAAAQQDNVHPQIVDAPAVAVTFPQQHMIVHPLDKVVVNPSGALVTTLDSLSGSRDLAASAPRTAPATEDMMASAASTVLSAPQMCKNRSTKQQIAQQASATDTAPPAWASAAPVPSVVHAKCLCAAAGADDLDVDVSGLPAAAGQHAQSSHCCSQIGWQQTPLQQQPQAWPVPLGCKCQPQHAVAAICPAAPVLGQPVPHPSSRAERQTPKETDTSSSAWRSTIQVHHPFHRRSTGEQVRLNTSRLLGSGGCGCVIEVDVKFCGADSLAAVQKPNTALARLLRRAQCACGVHRLGSSSRSRGHAVDDSSSDEEDDDDYDIDASPTSFVVANSECSRDCCSIRLALKIATAYNDLPANVQCQYTPEQYQLQVQREFYNEHTLMHRCSKSQYIIDCYCVGSIEYKGQQQMCLLLELSQLGSADQYTIRGGAARGRSDVEAQRIVQQVAAGLADMHYMANTLHRDVKLSNLLLFGSLQNPHIKLCDFGISRRLVTVGDYGNTPRGTPDWMAPEQSDSSIGQDYRVDTYALGLLVLALRRAAPPFHYLLYPWVSAEERAANRVAAALDDPSNPYNQDVPGFSSALGQVEKAFVKRCLIHDISRRPAPSVLLLTDVYLRKSYSGG